MMTVQTQAPTPMKASAENHRIEAVIFDWAGTTVDFGSLAPIHALQRLFARHAIELDITTARGPMGKAKRDHIAAVLSGLSEVWRARYSRLPTDEDVDRLYAELTPIQLEILDTQIELIPGVVELVQTLRSRGVRIGATTGYNRTMFDPVQRQAAALGYSPEICLTADDVSRGRPYPDMTLRCVEALQATSVACCVKVDDTPVGIAEGLNAGMWTVGVAVSGNAVGLSLPQWRALSNDEQRRLSEGARRALVNAGAHFVIDTVADLVPCLELIDARLCA